MADGDLFQADLAIAFAFSRSEAGAYRDAAGNPATADANTPRFDHDGQGAPTGLLIAPGNDLGGGDRLAFDPLMLPAILTDSDNAIEREATVFHCFIPASGDGAILHHAWYSRDAAALIDTLMRQGGNHLSIGVMEGFRENLGGYVRYRSQVWQLTGILEAEGGLLATDDGRPLVSGGAEMPAELAGA